MTDHFYEKRTEREVSMDDIKAAIENPDSVTDDKHDERGKIYWKWFDGYHIKVCLNHKRRVPLAKTVYKYLDD